MGSSELRMMSEQNELLPHPLLTGAEHLLAGSLLMGSSLCHQGVASTLGGGTEASRACLMGCNLCVLLAAAADTLSCVFV